MSDIEQRASLEGAIGIKQSDIPSEKFYTKEEIDELLDQKQDTLTEEQMEKIDSSATIREVEELLETKQDTLTEEQLEKINNAITELPIASDTDLGAIRVGSTLSIDENGVLDVLNSGDSELTKDITTNTDVGAIPKGSKIKMGTTFTQLVERLTVAELAPTISFSITKSGNVAYGESYRETLTVNVSNMGTARSIDTIEWYEGNTLKQTDEIGSQSTGSWSYTMPEDTNDNATFKAIVKYTKSDDTQATITKTASISFYYNKFYGAVDTLTPDESTVEALFKTLGTGKGGTYSFNLDDQRIAYAYPTNLGALSSIKDVNGFNLTNSFTRTTVTYTQNGQSIPYYLYILTDSASASGYSVIFA